MSTHLKILCLLLPGIAPLGLLGQSVLRPSSDINTCLWGYRDSINQWVITPRFNYAHDFREDQRAVVSLGKKWGLIDRSGNYIAEPQYEGFGFCGNWLKAEECYCFGQNGKAGVMDANGQILYPPLFETVEYGGDSTVIYSSRKNKETLYGLADMKGRVLTPAIYQHIARFGHGVAICSIEDTSSVRKSYLQKRDPYSLAPTLVGMLNKKGELIYPCAASVVNRVQVNDITYMQVVKKGYRKTKQGITEATRYGLADTTGKELFACVYDYLYPMSGPGFIKHCFYATARGKTMLINRKGDTLLSFRSMSFYKNQGTWYVYASDHRGDHLLRLQNDHFVYIASCDHIINIAPDYGTKDTAVPGPFIFARNNKYGLMDITGAILMEPEYDTLQSVSRSILFTRKNNRYGLAGRDGKVLIANEHPYILFGVYDHFAEAEQGIPEAEQGMPDTYVIDSAGFFYKLHANGSKSLYPSKDAEVTVLNGIGPGYEIPWGEVPYNCAIVFNKKGRVVSGPAVYIRDMGSPYCLIDAVDANGNRGIISYSGDTIVPFRYTSVYVVPSYYPCLENCIAKDYHLLVFHDKKQGLYDRKGNRILDAIYEEISAYNEEQQCWIVKNSRNKSGIMNEAGVAIVPFIYDSIGALAPHAAIVYTARKAGVVTLNSKMILPCLYDAVSNAGNGLYWICKANKYGLADQTGKIIFQPRFDRCYAFYNGYALVKQNRKWGLISAKGTVVEEPRARRCKWMSVNLANYLLDSNYFEADEADTSLPGIYYYRTKDDLPYRIPIIRSPHAYAQNIVCKFNNEVLAESITRGEYHTTAALSITPYSYTLSFPSLSYVFTNLVSGDSTILFQLTHLEKLFKNKAGYHKLNELCFNELQKIPGIEITGCSDHTGVLNACGASIIIRNDGLVFSFYNGISFYKNIGADYPGYTRKERIEIFIDKSLFINDLLPNGPLYTVFRQQ